MMAAIAFQDHDAAVLIAAAAHGLQGVIMARQQFMPVLFI
jgi:hypothetical protein